MRHLEPGAYREEVLAAVRDSEEREERLFDEIRAGGVTHTRCGRRGTPVLLRDVGLQRQVAAGEEDQSVPGWDCGP